jgi:hypothetical protein
MIFECKGCKKQFENGLNMLSGFTVSIKIPQFNKTTGRSTGHIVRSAAYIGLCENCAEKAKNLSILKSEQDNKEQRDAQRLGELVKLIFLNDNEQGYYTEKKL